jgi:hypothetical protein
LGEGIERPHCAEGFSQWQRHYPFAAFRVALNPLGLSG